MGSRKLSIAALTAAGFCAALRTFAKGMHCHISCRVKLPARSCDASLHKAKP
jgi:hypothetical protein